MRLLVQRVSRASVDVAGETVGEIGPGLLVLAGFGIEDQDDAPGSPLWDKLLNKLLGLRIFSDENGKMNQSVRDAQGSLLVVSQFTLHADCRKGMRPSFAGFSARPELAETLYHRLVDDLRDRHDGVVATGRFGAEMQVELVNDGPVTILLDSRDFTSG
ncbi:D-tyrosyl-tRNA(Tyr) deacylase [Paucidesulfovibrio gracilis DSM 16080]|uniref:D-aminoacyl-tRNA deacylase n=1 Tax=Paucidesulfovibrio gracilis DSM 16080 TaxID=1121449 RepID=A0A1T4Y2F5_9BACT|nr:D-aminoacyl-tRNA deacylase [Paucidesulfovibrio gracilis]SKA95994.1 D-tyrosyl-tRNA(Tyr) deacylase [Paucidesulfovibrio gracilis DSM 16080]